MKPTPYQGAVMSQILHELKRSLFQWRFAQEARLIEEIRRRRLTYCGYPKLESLAESMARVKKRRARGNFLEAGVALGGSAILIARAKPKNTPLYLYDVFGMIPPPSQHDGPDAHARYHEIKSGSSRGLGDDLYYGYRSDLEEAVVNNLKLFGVEPRRDQVRLVRGRFEDSLHVCEPIAFAHVDCDWYDSVMTCLTRLAPNISLGGEMVFDDYSSYSGCRRAVDEFLETAAGFRLVKVDRSATLQRVA